MINKIVFLLYLVGVATGLFGQAEQVKLKILMLVREGLKGIEFRESFFACTSFAYREIWSFNKIPGGKYIPDAADKSALNLVTIKSSGYLAEGMKLLEEKLYKGSFSLFLNG